jgi:formylmethanofuran dehydrogenase subunit E
VRGRGVGIVVGLFGAAVWALIAVAAHSRIRFVAIAVGVLIGLAMRSTVRSTDDARAPIHAGTTALFSILLGEYLTSNVVAVQVGAEIGKELSAPLGLGDFLFVLAQTSTPSVYVFWLIAASAAYAQPAAKLAYFTQRQIAELERADAEHLERRIRDVDARPKKRVELSAKVACAICEELCDAGTTTRTARGIVCQRCLPRAGQESVECGGCRERFDPVTMTSHTQYGLLCEPCAARFAKRRATGTARVACEVCEELVDAATTNSYEEREIVCEACYQQLEVGLNRDAKFR